MQNCILNSREIIIIVVFMPIKKRYNITKYYSNHYSNLIIHILIIRVKIIFMKIINLQVLLSENYRVMSKIRALFLL